MVRACTRVRPTMPRHLALLLLLLLLLAPRSVRADAIEGPPACPPGARGRSSHSGTWCEAAPCASDADCSDVGGHCRPWRVCTRRASIPMGGHAAMREPAPAPFEIDLVVGSCEPTRACRGDEEPPPPIAGTYVAPTPTCQQASFCVPDSLPTLPLISTGDVRGADATQLRRPGEPGTPAEIGAAAPSPTPAPLPSSTTSRVAPTSSSSCSCAAPGRSHDAREIGPMLALLALALRRRRR